MGSMVFVRKSDRPVRSYLPPINDFDGHTQVNPSVELKTLSRIYAGFAWGKYSC